MSLLAASKLHRSNTRICQPSWFLCKFRYLIGDICARWDIKIRFFSFYQNICNIHLLGAAVLGITCFTCALPSSPLGFVCGVACLHVAFSLCMNTRLDAQLDRHLNTPELEPDPDQQCNTVKDPQHEAKSCTCMVRITHLNSLSSSNTLVLAFLIEGVQVWPRAAHHQKDNHDGQLEEGTHSCGKDLGCSQAQSLDQYHRFPVPKPVPV